MHVFHHNPCQSLPNSNVKNENLSPKTLERFVEGIMHRLLLCLFLGFLLLGQLNCSGAKTQETTAETIADGSSTTPDGQPEQNTTRDGQPDQNPPTEATPQPETKTEHSPESTPETIVDLAPVNSDLILNEINAKGEPNDWCELFNRGNQDIDLSDYTISDEPTNPQKRTKFPPGQPSRLANTKSSR
jgi:hypothetical protein